LKAFEESGLVHRIANDKETIEYALCKDDCHVEHHLAVVVVDPVEGVDHRIECELDGVVLDGRLTAMEVVVEILEEDDATMGDRGEHQHHIMVAPVGVELNHMDG
jgi:hypothetical protein